MKILFSESQKFTQWWLWLILTGVAGIPVYGIYKQLFLGEVFGTRPISDEGLIFLAVFVAGLWALFLVMRLQTEIDRGEIRLKFVPFLKKIIPWAEVVSAEVKDYGFIGGWGIRISTKYGRAYNVTGSKGLVLTLKNGKKVLVGTQKEAELGAVVKTCI